jgi:hypothetical protein
LDPEHADNWLNLGPVLTLKTSTTSTAQKQTIRRNTKRK